MKNLIIRSILAFLGFAVLSTPSALAQTTFGSESTISTSYVDAISLKPVDLDGDGDLDLISVAGGNFNTGRADWWENDGGLPPQWTQKSLNSSLIGGWHADAADLDGDGDVDIVVLGLNELIWYENDGLIPPTFIARTISSTLNWGHTVTVADIDQDGRNDVVYTSGGQSLVGWFRNGGGQPLTWTDYVIGTNIGNVVSAVPADLDGDGDLDVVCSDNYGDKIVGLRNQGQPIPAFTQFDILTSVDGALIADCADLDGDGDLDVICAAGNDDQVLWIENLDGLGSQWTSQVIATGDVPFWVDSADLDNDGDIDVMAGFQGVSSYAWYLNDGGSPPSFSSQTLWTQALEPFSIAAGDLDGDLDLDIVTASRADSTLAWFENLLAPPLGPLLSQTGVCPGQVTLTVTQASAHGLIGILYGPAGTFTKSGSPCAGLTVGIASPTLGALIPADAAGFATLSLNAPSGACGRRVQGVDITSCSASNLIVL